MEHQHRLAIPTSTALTLAVGLSLVTLSSAAASVGYVTVWPQAASPGTVVRIAVDPYNCPIVDHAPDTMTMYLTRADAAPRAPDREHGITIFSTGEPSASTGQVRAYQFTVPRVPPGRYHVDVVCTVDGGVEGMVVANSDDAAFGVLPSPPGTTTVPSPARGGPQPTLPLIGLAGAAGLALLVVRRKTMTRR